jgi:nitrate reductase delta subunit
VTAATIELLGSAGNLLTYPSKDYGRQLPGIIAHLRDWDLATADALAAFEEYVRTSSVEHLQEGFTQTFDLNPVCALEVGWQLFGEEYERGAFMVRMRQLLREHGIDERGELPDHLSSLLAVLARLEPGQAQAFAADALVPAVEKMVAAIEKSDSPFRPVLQGIGLMVTACAAPDAEVAHV